MPSGLRSWRWASVPATKSSRIRTPSSPPPKPSGSNARNVHSYGFNSRLDDLHAGVLSAKLKHIDAWNDLRRKWAARYSAGLKGCGNLDLPVELIGYRHVFHLFVVETKQPGQREPFLKFLNDAGIDAKTHYSIPIHQQAGDPGDR